MIKNLAVAIGVGIVWFGLVFAVFRPEKALRKHTIKIFILGMLICVPIGLFNTAWMLSLQLRFASSESSLPGWLIWSILYILVAPIEEIIKFLIVRSESYRLKSFDTVEEGVLLAAVSALGFATYENFGYMQQVGFQAIYLRGWLLPPAHILFSVFFGYYLGLAKTRRYKRMPLIIEGLFFSSLLHGVYNASTQTGFLHYILVAAYLAYYLRYLKTERHVPVLSRIAPELMQVTEAVRPERSLHRPRLPVIDDPETTTVINRILAGFDSLDKNKQLAAIRNIGALQDQRLFEGLKRLCHDPSAAVRREADRALQHMNRTVQQLLKQELKK